MLLVKALRLWWLKQWSVEMVWWKIQNEMTDALYPFMENIYKDSKLINGVKEFLICVKMKIFLWQYVLINWTFGSWSFKKNGIYDYFEYVAGYNTFEYCKPDPRHLTTTIEILNGKINKSLMIGDSETDANAAKAAEIPIILLKYGYTEKKSDEIYHNHLVKDFIGIEKIISEYL